MNNSRFTLVELLVVIAIISILAALLLPTLQKAQDQALTAVCVSNQRQLAITFVSYSDDHQGWLPPASMFYNGTNYRWTRHLERLSYIPKLVAGAETMTSCPTWIPKVFSNPDFAYGVPNSNKFLNGAGANTVGADLAYPRRLDKLDDVDVMLTDSARCGTGSGAQWAMLNYSTSGGEGVATNKAIHLRHGDFLYANAAMRDAHVETIPLKFIVEGKRYVWTMRRSTT